MAHFWLMILAEWPQRALNKYWIAAIQMRRGWLTILWDIFASDPSSEYPSQSRDYSLTGSSLELCQTVSHWGFWEPSTALCISDLMTILEQSNSLYICTTVVSTVMIFVAMEEYHAPLAFLTRAGGSLFQLPTEFAFRGTSVVVNTQIGEE